eukprot:COSAG05_NODE_1556_length_4568_cov_2.886776_5_plen_246_part_00
MTRAAPRSAWTRGSSRPRRALGQRLWRARLPPDAGGQGDGEVGLRADTARWCGADGGQAVFVPQEVQPGTPPEHRPYSPAATVLVLPRDSEKERYTAMRDFGTWLQKRLDVRQREYKALNKWWMGTTAGLSLENQAYSKAAAVSSNVIPRGTTRSWDSSVGTRNRWNSGATTRLRCLRQTDSGRCHLLRYARSDSSSQRVFTTHILPSLHQPVSTILQVSPLGNIELKLLGADCCISCNSIPVLA